MFGTNNGIISNLKAWKSEKDNGTITYSATVNGEDSETMEFLLTNEWKT